MMQKVDNSAVGNMRDCGECHVGGGGMEYFPRNEGWDGTAGPDAVDAVDNSTIAWIQDPAKSYPSYIQDPAVTLVETPDGEQDFDAYGNLLWENSPRVAYRDAAQFATEYTSFNYFVDIFDDDGDGDFNEVLYNDYSKTGVVEMDCLACHMEGYSWDAAKAAKRDGRFDASRAAGAGFGTVDTSREWDAVANTVPEGFGTTVVYDEDAVTLTTSYWGTGLTVNLNGKIHATPPTENCATCHQGKYQVDWKKRGEMAADADVHEVIGCMGCHERTDYLRGVNPNTDERDSRHLKGETVGTSLNIRDGKLGHDPAKGGAGQWDSLNNKNDWKNFKGCKGCHDGSGLGDRGKSYGAPNPSAAHAAAGLSATIVQKKGTISGVANGSHLDIISCEACHITKASEVPHTMTDYAGNTVDLTYATGGGFVDGTAPDHEGRLATHDTYEVSRSMYTDEGGSNFGYTWAKDGKIHPGNFLTSLFWRDKNDEQLDVNVDGRPHGMDAVLPTHVLANALTQMEGTEHEGHAFYYGILADGVSTDAEVQEHIAELSAALPGLTGVDPTGTDGFKLKLSWVTVPFTMSHQIEPAADAYGANGCTDCHGSDAFYAGSIDLNGYSSFGFDPANTAPMTKVNGMSEKSFGHPNMKDKAGLMSISLMNNNGPAATGATATIRDLDREEALYQATFQTRDTAFKTELIGGDIETAGSLAPANMKSFSTWKGWYLNVEVDADDDNVVDSDASIWLGPSNAAMSHPFAHPDADPTAAELLAVIPDEFTDGGNLYHFNVGLNDAGNGLKITAESGYEIRLAFNSFYGPFGFKGETVVAQPIIPTCKGIDADDSISGRAEMVAYLNALGAPGVDPTKTVGEECFELGVTPTIDNPMTVNGTTTTGGTALIEVATDAAVTLGVEDNAVTGGTVSYSYYNINDEAVTELAGNSVTFTDPGTYRVVVTTTTAEGKVAQSYQYVTVKAPAAGVDSMEAVATGQDVVLTLTVADFPAGTANIAISWGDGGALSFVDPLTLAEVTADNTIDYTYTGTAVGSEVKVRFSNSDNETLGIWHDVVK